MKKYHSFGKRALPALLITILIGTTLGCPDDSAEDEPVLQSIAVTSPPTKTVYVKGDSLDISGLVVTGTYSGGTTKVETVSASDISGYDATTTGTQTVTVTVGGKTATFTVTVNTAALESIAVTSQPTKTVYTQGEALDLSGLVVTGTYADGTTKAETVTMSNISRYNANTVGQQTVTVTLNGKTATFTVTVSNSALQSIAITSPPTKTGYSVGEALNLSGLVVTGTYTDGTTKTETVGIADISGYDANTTGTQTLTVTVNGKTATFSVSVSVILQNITEVMTELTNAPGGLIAASPVSLRLGLNLTTSEWKDILEGIAAVGKYVSLDLSACTMSGTEFDPGADVDASKVAALVLPDAAKSIKAGTYSSSSFKDFTALRSLSGAGIETIGDYVFRGCTSLTTVSLPASLTTIARSAFSGCESLTTITVDPANTAFAAHDGMLLDKAGTTLIAYPSASGAITIPFVTDIGESVFSGYTSLTEVSLPAATTIGYSAFSDCTSLTEVSLPVATSIGVGAFSRCTSLTEVSLPVATSIGDYAFYGCASLTDVSLPVATTISSQAFWDCTSLTEVSLPASLTTVLSNPFARCTALTTITVDPANTAFVARDGMLLNKAETTLIAYPSATGAITLQSITVIDSVAFYGCESLTTVSLPAATSIGRMAFYGCKSLTSVSLPATPPSIGSDIFSSTGSSGTITVRVPTGAVSAYTSTWNVLVSTGASDYTTATVYGYNHKAVLITDAAQ